MSVITATRSNIDANAGVYVRIQWPGLQLGDEGAPVLCPPLGDRAVQVSGTFGVGGNVRLLGSLDGVEYVPLSDPQGNPLDFAQAKIEAVMELAVWIKPQVTGGDGTTNLNLMLAIKGRE